MVDFEKLEKLCDEIRKINTKYIEEFMDIIRVDKEYWVDCCSEYNDGISEW